MKSGNTVYEVYSFSTAFSQRKNYSTFSKIGLHNKVTNTTVQVEADFLKNTTTNKLGR